MTDHEGGADDGTVLVVDDDRDVVDLYATQLSERYTVRRAHDGHEALDSLDDSVDVVLLDRRMPTLTGDEVLERIVEAGHNCRTVMVTAIGPDYDVLDMAFDEYLIKPVSKEALLETVAKQLRVDEYHDDLDELLRVRGKRRLMEAEKSAAELDDDDRYVDLSATAKTLCERLQAVLDGDIPRR